MGIHDQLSQLGPFSWRGVHFPCASFDVELSQDHAEHKYPDRDGAVVEATGRNPIIFVAKAIFRNGTKKGPTEGFPQGSLFPDQLNLFVKACADRTTGNLVHPLLGTFAVKCKSCKIHADPNRRDGVDVDVIWVEHTELDFDKILSESPLAAAKKAADDLDAELQLNADIAFKHAQSVPGLRDASFGQLMNAITSIFDTATLLQKQIVGKIDEIGYRLTVLSDAVHKVKDNKVWPIRQAIERLKSSLIDVRQRALATREPTSVYVTPKDTTLAAIAAYLHMSITELINLNPGLAGAAVIPAHTLVVYNTTALSDGDVLSSPVPAPAKPTPPVRQPIPANPTIPVVRYKQPLLPGVPTPGKRGLRGK